MTPRRIGGSPGRALASGVRPCEERKDDGKNDVACDENLLAAIGLIAQDAANNASGNREQVRNENGIGCNRNIHAHDHLGVRREEVVVRIEDELETDKREADDERGSKENLTGLTGLFLYALFGQADSRECTEA